MAITLTGTSGIMTRVGRLGGIVNSILNAKGAAALTAPSVSIGVGYTNLLAQFVSGSAQADLFDGFYTNIIAPARTKSATIAAIKTFAQQLLLRQVNDDTPLKAYTLQYAMAELVRQFGPNVADSKVTANSVAATTPTALTGNTGSTLCTSSKIGPLMPSVENTQGTNAMDLQNIFPETVTVRCTADSYTGGATQYQEPFSILGASALVTDPLNWNFTSLYGASATNGSGAQATGYACNAAVYQNTGVGGNVLNNGDMRSYTSHSPNQWVATAGAANTDFMDTGGTAASIIGGQCLVLKANAAQLVTLTQQFNNSGGTTYALKPNTVYAVNMYAKKDSGATGTIVLDLWDGASVINDNNAVANSLTFTIANVGTSYTNGTYVGWTYFRTPAVLPTTCYLRLRSSVHIAVADAYISHIAMKEVSQIYTGGPYIALFSGLTPAVLADGYSAPFTNNFGGGTNKAGFQTMFNWLFDVRSLGLPMLPIVGSNAIADSLVA